MIATKKLVALSFAYFLIAGCSSMDFDYPREESHFLPNTADTYLGKQLSGITADQSPDESGFYPLSNGIDALAVRLLLAERAEASIDVQYYLIKNDIVGRAFVHALLRAANRGVRIRLLLDDMFTSGYDIGLQALDSHPNFEIRIFNPFKRSAGGRTIGALSNFSRINRRMHNKSFTVDNQITLIGGRNIADEYFGAREDAKFGDLDVLTVGPMVQEVSNMFDNYWNHETALPVPAFVKKKVDDTDAALSTLKSRLAKSGEEVRDSKYADAIFAKITEYIDAEDSVFEWAPYQLVVDSPDKGIKSRAADADLITTPLFASLSAAKKEVVIVSPYFVPLKSGIKQLIALKATGVDVIIITNSLAANNQFTVHGGYAPARKPLLKAGIKLYEARADADVPGTEYVDASGAKATLHTKAFVVDRQQSFIGSFNFDPRSANINTELGVIINDPIMSRQFVETVHERLPSQTYEVFLNEKGQTRWRGFEDGEEVIYDKEPDTTWGERFKAGFFRILPIRSQL